jgi:hypothetical protein
MPRFRETEDAEERKGTQKKRQGLGRGSSGRCLPTKFKALNSILDTDNK